MALALGLVGAQRYFVGKVPFSLSLLLVTNVMSIAWLFPGQGSQKVGMADSLVSLEGAQARFSKASDLMGRDLFEICPKVVVCIHTYCLQIYTADHQ